MSNPPVAGFFMDLKGDRGVTTTEPNSSPARIPAGVWVLGFVSLFMDVSS
jgi:hypothetical protein